MHSGHLPGLTRDRAMRATVRTALDSAPTAAMTLSVTLAAASPAQPSSSSAFSTTAGLESPSLPAKQSGLPAHSAPTLAREMASVATSLTGSSAFSLACSPSSALRSSALLEMRPSAMVAAMRHCSNLLASAATASSAALPSRPPDRL